MVEEDGEDLVGEGSNLFLSWGDKLGVTIVVISWILVVEGNSFCWLSSTLGFGTVIFSGTITLVSGALGDGRTGGGNAVFKVVAISKTALRIGSSSLNVGKID